MTVLCELCVQAFPPEVCLCPDSAAFSHHSSWALRCLHLQTSKVASSFWVDCNKIMIRFILINLGKEMEPRVSHRLKTAVCHQDTLLANSIPTEHTHLLLGFSFCFVCLGFVFGFSSLLLSFFLFGALLYFSFFFFSLRNGTWDRTCSC